MGFVELGRANEMRLRALFMEERLAKLESAAGSSAPAPSETDVLREEASTKLSQGANLTREEAAAYLGVSTKTLQRMDAAGKLPRCLGMGTVVRYAARDVQRLLRSK